MNITGSPGSHQSGFSLVEVLIAIVILAGGLLALAMALAQGTVIMSTAHFHQIAKEKAFEAMESVFTARDARKIPRWEMINNQSNNGIFLDGPQPLRQAGPDGLVNTADDGAVEVYVQAGPDNIMGTEDDVRLTLSDFTREIEIRSVAANLRRIRIVIGYRVGHLARQYEMVCFISPFA